jgi:uncharacterized protein
MCALAVGGTGEDLRIRVRVKPRASRSKVLPARDGLLEVAVAAPPAEGAANAELVAVLASALGLPRRNIEIVTGASSRIKSVRIRGLTGAELTSRLSGGEARR